MAGIVLSWWYKGEWDLISRSKELYRLMGNPHPSLWSEITLGFMEKLGSAQALPLTDVCEPRSSVFGTTPSHFVSLLDAGHLWHWHPVCSSCSRLPDCDWKSLGESGTTYSWPGMVTEASVGRCGHTQNLDRLDLEPVAEMLVPRRMSTWTTKHK